MPLELVDDIGLFEEENNEVSPKSKLIDNAGVYKATPSMQQAPWIARHPNLYGIYGAGKEVAFSFLPYLKYVDPSERERFKKLSTQKQTRELLQQNLEMISMLGAGPITKSLTPLVAKYLPKTYKAFQALKRPIKILEKRTWAQKAAQYIKKREAWVQNRLKAGDINRITAYQEFYSKFPPPWPKGGIPKTPAQTQVMAKEAIKRKGTPLAEKELEIPAIKKAIPKTKVLRNVEEEEIVKGAIEKAIANPDDPIVLDETKRAFQKIAHLTQTEQIEPGMMQEIVKRYAETPEQLAKEILKAGTYSGRTLNYFSQFSKAMLRAFPKNEEVKNLLGKIANRPRSAWEWFMDKYKAVDNPRRMLMVSQLATASRNAASQGIRYTIDIFDKAVLGTMKALGGEHPAKAYAEAFADITALFGRISPTRRKALEAILKKYPIEKAKLNRGQEYFFRRMAFDAKLTALCKKAGIDKIKATPKMIEESAKHALKLTYAATPESVPGKAIMALYQKVPILTTVQPYPRFWLNAMRFLWEFNPTGYIDTGIHLAQKNPEKAARAASKALVGSALLATAFAARTSKYAGIPKLEMQSIMT